MSDASGDQPQAASNGAEAHADDTATAPDVAQAGGNSANNNNNDSSSSVAPAAEEPESAETGEEKDEQEGLAGGDGAAGEEEDAALSGIAVSEVKNIILQVLSPYFDDEDSGAAGAHGGVDASVGAAAAGEDGADESGSAAEVDAVEDTAQRYDHTKARSWVSLVCDGVTERLVALGRPFKYVTHVAVMRRSGAGMHVCSSNYYSTLDGWISHSHDLSLHIYAVVTVYWLAI